MCFRRWPLQVQRMSRPCTSPSKISCHCHELCDFGVCETRFPFRPMDEQVLIPREQEGAVGYAWYWPVDTQYFSLLDCDHVRYVVQLLHEQSTLGTFISSANFHFISSANFAANVFETGSSLSVWGTRTHCRTVSQLTDLRLLCMRVRKPELSAFGMSRIVSLLWRLVTCRKLVALINCITDSIFNFWEVKWSSEFMCTRHE
jgi:hypothetical protein